MLNWIAPISRLGFIVGLFAFLRQRWKVAGMCLATAVIAEYLHAEFVDHLQLLASMREVDGIVEYLSVAFVLKNAFVISSIVAYVIFEVRLSRRRKVDVNHVNLATNMPRNWLPSAARLWSARRRHATASAPEDAQGAKTDTTQDFSDETSPTDDGFDFLRDGRRLRTHAEKLMQSE